MLKIGDRFPEFSLAASDGRTVSASSLRGTRFVMFFYPRDNTPGCTTEACAFRDNLAAFAKLGVLVFGISADDDTSHQRFVRKYALNFPLLADPTLSLLKACGTWIEKSMYGRRYMGVARSTFVIGSDARVEIVWEKVAPANHANEVLDYLKGVVSAGSGMQLRSSTRPSADRPTVRSKAVSKTAPGNKPAARSAAGKVAVKKVLARKAAKKSTGRNNPVKSAQKTRTTTRKPVARAPSAKRR